MDAHRLRSCFLALNQSFNPMNFWYFGVLSTSTLSRQVWWYYACLKIWLKSICFWIKIYGFIVESNRYALSFQFGGLGKLMHIEIQYINFMLHYDLISLEEYLSTFLLSHQLHCVTKNPMHLELFSWSVWEYMRISIREKSLVVSCELQLTIALPQNIWEETTSGVNSYEDQCCIVSNALT